eukprot:COSAG02_NODE_16394_length_1087_cov_1.242915_2_plen_102_part_00
MGLLELQSPYALIDADGQDYTRARNPIGIIILHNKQPVHDDDGLRVSAEHSLFCRSASATIHGVLHVCQERSATSEGVKRGANSLQQVCIQSERGLPVPRS